MAAYLTTVYLQQIIQHRMCENSHYRKDVEGIGGDTDIYLGGTETQNEEPQKE